MDAEDVRFIINEFEGEECQCEQSKKSRMSFCFSCYNSLPAQMKRQLYRKFGDGYVEAYERALKFLND